MKQKKAEQNDVLKYCGHLGYKMVIVCGVIGKPSYNNSENYKDKYFECLMCAGHFQCLHFRHFGVLKLQHVKYCYRKPQTQY